jgi:hypothetical protein
LRDQTKQLIMQELEMINYVLRELTYVYMYLIRINWIFEEPKEHKYVPKWNAKT